MANTSKALITGSFLRTLDLSANILAAFFIMPFVISHLGDRWYGIWVIVGGFMGYYGLLDFGISSATNRFIALHMGAGQEKDVNASFNTSIGIFSLIGLIALCVSLVLLWIVPQFITGATDITLMRKVLILMGLDMAVSFPYRAFLAILSAKLRYDLISYASIGKNILRIVLIIYFIGRGYSIFSLAVITIVVNMCERLVIIMMTRKVYPVLRLNLSMFDTVKVKEYLGYSIYSFMVGIADMIRFKLDIMVVAYFLGSAVVTHYNIALSLHDYSGQLTMALITGTLPVLVKYFSQNDFDNLREKFLMLTRFHLLIAVTISGAVIILSRPFISLWVGPSYLDAIIPLIILRSVSFLGGGQNSSIQIMYAMAKHKFYAWITLGEAVVNLILSLMLVKPYGMAGVALGTVMPFVFVKFLIIPFYVCKLLNISAKKYFSHLIYFFSLPALAQIPFYSFIQWSNPNSYFLLVVYSVLFYLGYGYCLFKFLLSSIDRSYLFEAVPMLKKI